MHHFELHVFNMLGVFTKPDIVQPGDEVEFISVLNNEKVHLKKGFTVVKCRSQKEMNEGVTLEESLQNEKEFFAKTPHFRYRYI